MQNQAKRSKNQPASMPEKEDIGNSKVLGGHMNETRIGAQQDLKGAKNLGIGAESGALLSSPRCSDWLETHVTVEAQHSTVPVRDPSALRDSLKPGLD